MDMPQDQYELYAEFGITAEKAQVLEVAAGNVALGFLATFIDAGQVTPEVTAVFRSVVDDVNRKTFGALLKHIRKTMNLSDSMVTIIDEALERRNHLTHHFFRTHNLELFSEEGRKNNDDRAEGDSRQTRCGASDAASHVRADEPDRRPEAHGYGMGASDASTRKKGGYLRPE